MSEGGSSVVDMNDPLVTLLDAIAGVGDAWPVSASGQRLAVESLDQAQLVAANESLGRLRRHLDAVHSRVASEIARQSRPELGPDGLAKKHGYRNPIALVAATTGTTNGDAARLVAVGEATTPRRTFSGEDAPARHPHVAAGLASGSIGMPAASAIIAMLDRVAFRCDRETLDAAEQTLVQQAAGLTLDQLAKVIARAEAHLDPDGLEPKESELRADRSVHMFERAGMLHLRATLDPETAAPVKTAIEALVSAEFRAQADAQRGSGAGAGAAGAGVGTAGEGAGPGGQSALAPTDPDAPRRTVPQMQADALALIASHFLGCDTNDAPVHGATVIVRMTLDQLTTGAGAALIDGIDQPVTVATARRMAAGGGIIPCVLGSHGEILDWGREKRLFTRAQKLALAERDGGCAGCGLPPGMTKVHHIRWWARDAGPTDLDNGILLCDSCHHRVHDNGWDIRIDGTGITARVWFIPPAHVDPCRAPRLGGRARYDYAA